MSSEIWLRAMLHVDYCVLTSEGITGVVAKIARTVSNVSTALAGRYFQASGSCADLFFTGFQLLMVPRGG